MFPYLLLLSVDHILPPGAVISGLNSKSGVVPQDVKSDMLPLTVLGTDIVLPFATTLTSEVFSCVAILAPNEFPINNAGIVPPSGYIILISPSPPLALL